MLNENKLIEYYKGSHGHTSSGWGSTSSNTGNSGIALGTGAAVGTGAIVGAAAVGTSTGASANNSNSSTKDKLIPTILMSIGGSLIILVILELISNYIFKFKITFLRKIRFLVIFTGIVLLIAGIVQYTN